MQIQAGATYGGYSITPSQPQSISRAAAFLAAPSASPAAKNTDAVTLSDAAKALLARSLAASNASSTVRLDTDKGSLDMNIDAYFTPDAAATSFAELPPLLLPSQNNVDALSKHISQAMPQFLSENGIPSAPSSITYGTDGQIQISDQYPYADQFKQALARNPTMERELRTVNALASHLAEMKKSIPFQQAYAAAKSPVEQDAVVNQYSDLFSANRQYSQIALQFDTNGRLSLTADGQLLE